MKRKTLFNLLPVLSLALALGALLTNLPGIVGAQELGPQAAMGTAFTYQGRLTDGDEPANGTYDFEFKVYDDLTGDNQVGGTVPANDIAVTDGFFTVELNFGSGVFTGEARYLEIGVQPGEGTGDFTILSPRQPLMPAPYALHATSATSLNAADGDPQGALIVDNEGNVGIGTTSPGAQLDVQGVISASSTVMSYGQSIPDTVDLRAIVTKGTADSFCPAGSAAIHVPWPYRGQTGDAICAANAQSLRTCAAANAVYTTIDNNSGAYPPLDKSCNDAIPSPWPWGLARSSPSTLASEWRIDTWVVCCQ